MKPFRLNIIGNICSGKTELIELIKKDFENAKYFSIDEYRKNTARLMQSQILLFGKD